MKPPKKTYERPGDMRSRINAYEKERLLDEAADRMAEEILSGKPDIGKCFALGLKVMKDSA